ncbi:MAG TPA: methylmalonyl-CoA epimerase [Dehalococcoidales bacterium]|nr:methylmalonyl-CoA epimerase [Dehalococcoidales bacterium]
MITKINHIGIAVNSIDAYLKFYTEALGLKLDEIEVVQEQKVRTAIIKVGESKIELLESTDPEGTIAKFIQNKGEGLHHLAFETDDVKATLAELKKQGVPLIDNEPRKGVQNTKMAFLHPKTARVLVEVVEEPKK